MIAAKCPLRISLIGGSTDSIPFLEKYKVGNVISFTPDLYTFVTINENNAKKYIINYSKKEECSSIEEIKNDIVRECFKYFGTPYCTITFNSDILATGSGLASSSSYTLSVIKALSLYHSIPMTDIEICNLGLEIERRFNPLAGMQDIYGCGIGGFKKITFNDKKTPLFSFMDFSFITNEYDIFLLNTGIVRNSTDVLQTYDVEKSYPLLKLTEQLEEIIHSRDKKTFFDVFNDGWSKKKTTSAEIINNETIQTLDNFLVKMSSIAGYKLCGAGGGGYFLIFVDKKRKNQFNKIISGRFPSNQLINIAVDSCGIRGVRL
jgi:D-glycero-alpha-D-manno-heptose-7-phosphate kinase